MKGATDGKDYVNTFADISIRAPVKGATFQGFRLHTDRRYFNPRSREGSDICLEIEVDPVPDFNPRSREGSDAGAAGPEADT